MKFVTTLFGKFMMYASSLNFMDTHYPIDLEKFFYRGECSLFKTIENQCSHFVNSIRSIFFRYLW